MPDVKPCPFCGGEAVKRQKSGDERDGYSKHVYYECKECLVWRGARGESDGYGYADNSTVDERALKRWNERV